MIKFTGTYPLLKEKVSQLNIPGVWNEDLPKGQKQFKASDGANFSWYQTTGTFVFGGQAAAKKRLEEKLTPLLRENEDSFYFLRTNKPKKVFVVYGHDQVSRNQLETMLRRWGLEPLILDQLPSKGQTVIEKLEEYIQDVGFGIVLATPDDTGFKAGQETEQAPRARQNVVLELGMLLAKLGRNRVAILLGDPQMERPSDIHGLIYIPFGKDFVKDVGIALAKEMLEQGYDIDIKNF